MDLTNNGSSGGTSCLGPQSVTPNTGGNPPAFLYSSTSFQDASFPFSTPLTSTFSTLEVTSIPALTVSTNSIRIKKITITETPPAVSFNITPATASIACGSTTPVTFTINNGGGTTGITGYTWNLGAAPNGWLLPNGTAAPATYSTGTTNTLSLTSVCGGVQASISATVTANGSNYSTNTTGVTYTIPSLSISGNSSLCSGTTQYSIPGLPCNATVSWTSSNTSVATITPSGNPATLTQAGSGNITLTAVVSGLCGTANQTFTKSVAVGSVPSNATIVIGNYTHYLQTNNDVCVSSGSTNIQIVFDPSAQNLSAYAYSGNYPTVYQSGNQWVVLYSLGSAGVRNGTGTLSIQYTTACGNITQVVTFHNTCLYYSAYTVSPNPASSEVIASVKQTTAYNSETNTSTTENSITEIKIYDQLGNLKKYLKYNKGYL